MADSNNFDDALEIFEEKVRDNIKLLSAKDAKSRMKAAAWLGEAGDPTAITMLKQVYKDDPDPKVRATAQYSLGMFRKLEEELHKSDQTKVQKLLEDVAVRGKMGRRVPVPVRSLVKLEIGMIISAVLVALAALILPPVFRQTVTQAVQQTNAPAVPTTAPVVDKDRPALISDLQAALTLISNSATALQTQYQTKLGGGEMNCSAYFDTLTPVVLTPANATSFPDLATLATDINTLQTGFTTAKGTYDRVCDSGETLEASEFGAPMGQVVGLMQSITTTQAALAAAAAQPA